MKRLAMLLAAMTAVSSCASSQSGWRLLLKHDQSGNVISGDVQRLVGAVRNGCDIRVAWGARARSDERRTIEHVSTPLWVAVRNGETVEVQLDDYLINLSVLGEPEDAHPQREPFGGTGKAVMWRANFSTTGEFNAVWYDAATGAFINRVPQTHVGSWFADCDPREVPPLFDVE